MKALFACAAVGLSLIAPMGPASAQYYEPREYYEERGPRYRERDYDYSERGPRYRDHEGPRYRERAYAFDERWYLRCHPDVLRAVRRGQMESAWVHYQRHGRAEGRRLRC